MDSSILQFSAILSGISLMSMTIAGYWRLFEKAGEAGWLCLIPVYNLVILFKITGKPLWQLLLLFIPFANLYVWLSVTVNLCKSFGKTGADSYLLAIFFNFAYVAFLGFSGDVRYQGAAENKRYVPQVFV